VNDGKSEVRSLRMTSYVVEGINGKMGTAFHVWRG